MNYVHTLAGARFQNTRQTTLYSTTNPHHNLYYFKVKIGRYKKLTTLIFSQTLALQMRMRFIHYSSFLSINLPLSQIARFTKSANSENKCGPGVSFFVSKSLYFL